MGWKKRGERKKPLSPFRIALAPIVAKAQQLGRIQVKCLAGKLSWAAYYSELINLNRMQEELETEWHLLKNKESGSRQH